MAKYHCDLCGWYGNNAVAQGIPDFPGDSYPTTIFMTCPECGCPAMTAQEIKDEIYKLQKWILEMENNDV